MISVVIPLYNKAAHIAETIKSVLAQTVAPEEIIVVDDGSTDNGAAVVRQFSGSGVRLIEQQNQGVSSARNVGLQEAIGRHVLGCFWMLTTIGYPIIWKPLTVLSING